MRGAFQTWFSPLRIFKLLGVSVFQGYAGEGEQASMGLSVVVPLAQILPAFHSTVTTLILSSSSEKDES